MGLSDEYRRELLRREQCRLLNHPQAEWVKRQNADQSWHFMFRCHTCGPVTRDRYGSNGHYVTREQAGKLSGQDPDRFFTLDSEIRFNLCAKCLKTVTCHQHHIVPQSFSPESKDWPSLPLCPECHTRWHELVTPGLSVPHDPVYHAHILTKSLKRPHLENLWREVKKRLEGTP